MQVKNQAGRAAWLRFNRCVILSDQHRFSNATPDGAELWQIVQRLSAESALSEAECATLCDRLNAKAVTPEQLNDMMQTGPPRVVVTRNALRNPLNRNLYKHHASFHKKRLITWYTQDAAVTGRQRNIKLSAPLQQLVRALSPDKTDGIPGQQYFFEGITYRMTDNIYPQVSAPAHLASVISLIHARYEGAKAGALGFPP